ncbi:YiiX/YebB-like N1pC/P60 family cysteine hydrolase [Snodgrassella gandavensis]|uniref:YiiX/YebB-like N1pC/P60 family cysteine hydrolase n=1 Tax=Snodgrassella gandavensis TaxID=2946698 RepID=UPI001EF67ED5|nr:YiiX/YebB-like N1pC/P60 family cysteine hydrolase [Snodgrassella gandavensis]
MCKHHKYFICFLLIILILVGGAVTFFYERHRPSQYGKLQNLPSLKIGDWVVRLGTINDSRWISYLGKSEYSHIGMIVQLHPKILVVHATTDDGESASNQVIVSELDHFLSPELAQKGAIIRPMFLNQQEKQQIAAFVLNQRGKPFILNSKDEPHLYCTTLLSDSIAQFHPSFKPKWNYISVPFFKGEYLFPQAFVDYPDIKVIYQFDSLII